MKLSTVGIPLLIGLGVFFYLADINGFPSIENNQKPELKSPQPPSESPKPKPKPKPKGYKECMRLSNEQHKRDMSEFRRIDIQAEVTYGRIRDDRYGKGLNTITKEQLEREKKCFEDGMNF
tara:strand:+ start:109 stop:471 length:363 start_codon:yes stop_codon:yes gene_type:complete